MHHPKVKDFIIQSVSHPTQQAHALRWCEDNGLEELYDLFRVSQRMWLGKVLPAKAALQIEDGLIRAYKIKTTARSWLAVFAPNSFEEFSSVCSNYGIVSALMLGLQVGIVGSMGHSDWENYGHVWYKNMHAQWFYFRGTLSICLLSFVTVMCAFLYLAVQNSLASSTEKQHALVLTSFAPYYSALHITFIGGLCTSGFELQTFVQVKIQSFADHGYSSVVPVMQPYFTALELTVGVCLVLIFLHVVILKRYLASGQKNQGKLVGMNLPLLPACAPLAEPV